MNMNQINTAQDIEQDVFFRKDFESIKSVKSFSGYDIKLVILASDDRVNDCEIYIEEGFDEYIIKPINKKNINHIMKKYLK